jgi:hypothetical protein
LTRAVFVFRSRSGSCEFGIVECCRTFTGSAPGLPTNTLAAASYRFCWLELTKKPADAAITVVTRTSHHNRLTAAR